MRPMCSMIGVTLKNRYTNKDVTEWCDLEDLEGDIVATAEKDAVQVFTKHTHWRIRGAVTTSRRSGRVVVRMRARRDRRSAVAGPRRRINEDVLLGLLHFRTAIIAFIRIPFSGPANQNFRERKYICEKRGGRTCARQRATVWFRTRDEDRRAMGARSRARRGAASLVPRSICDSLYCECHVLVIRSSDIRGGDPFARITFDCALLNRRTGASRLCMYLPVTCYTYVDVLRLGRSI
ncbi:hypothetical protein EVAR_16089_1 [Eumeta japonica]|uniref:Uncharacterized protein n=1 Tax=Eumeta variegata TaxID=151549 RepID=A0A4C1UJG8_EUMVA|nr:hypothetical protein EVAR_16089_1 [Eumeta japonica]